MCHGLRYKLGMLAITTLLSSCGELRPSDENRAGDADNAGSETQSEDVSLTITAKYKDLPVDLLVLRENSSRIRDNGAEFKLFSNGGSGDLGFIQLSTRLVNSGLDVRAAVLNAIAPSDGSTLGVIESDTNPAILVPKSFDFIDKFYERLKAMPYANDDWRLLTPYASLRALLKKSAKTGSNSSGFLRDGAFLSVIYVGYMDEKGESLDMADIESELNVSRGANNWKISVIGPEREGCEFTKNDIKYHANMDASAASSMDAAIYKDYQRRAKMIKLQEQSGGLFNSICAESHSEFIEKFITEGIRAPYFDVKLKQEPDPKTFSIVVGNTTIKDWKFNPSTMVLSLPKTIKLSTKVKITYKSLQPVAKEVTSSEGDKKDGKISKLGDVKLSPAEASYISDGVRTAMTSCRGCHAKYNTFANVFTDKDIISGRIKAGTMPPNNTTFKTSAEAKLITDWVSAN